MLIARVLSSEACAKTVQRRSNELNDIQDNISNDSTMQLHDEIKRLSSDERTTLHTSAGVTRRFKHQKHFKATEDFEMPDQVLYQSAVGSLLYLSS